MLWSCATGSLVLVQETGHGSSVRAFGADVEFPSCGRLPIDSRLKPTQPHGTLTFWILKNRHDLEAGVHSKPLDDRTFPPIIPGAIVLLLLAVIGGTGTPARADGQKLFKHPTPLTESPSRPTSTHRPTRMTRARGKLRELDLLPEQARRPVSNPSVRRRSQGRRVRVGERTSGSRPRSKR